MPKKKPPQFKKPETLLKAYLDGRISHSDYLAQYRRIVKQKDPPKRA